MSLTAKEIKDSIPYCFINDSEEYITVPAMKRFCDLNSIKHDNLRDDLISAITNFACIDDSNYKIFNNWMNKVLKEGIKHIYIREFIFNNSTIEIGLKNPQTVNTILSSIFTSCQHVDIWKCTPNSEMQLLNFYSTIIDDRVESISLEFAIRLIQANSKDERQSIIYPIFIDLDLVHNLIFCRAKSKNKIFDYTEDLSIEERYKRTTENLILKAEVLVRASLSLSYAPVDTSNAYLKNKIYNLFSISTFTPVHIQNQVDSYSTALDDFISHVNQNFNIPETYNHKMKEDLNIFIEKYLSVTQLSREDLQADRDFYPIKTASTDEEKTKHSTSSANYEPLQCKEKFFDTKKSIHSAKKCDSISFCHKRQTQKYFGSDPFTLVFDVLRGWCIMKLPKYVEEEDIKYVLSRFTEA